MFFFKIIFWTSIIFICLCVLIGIITHLLPIEIDNKTENTYENILITWFPISILLTLSGTIKPNDTGRTMGFKFLLTIFTTGLFVFMIFATSLGSGMCGWTTIKVLFENKQNHSNKIVKRTFGCGATDSGSPLLKIFEVKEISSYFIWVSEVDTNNIDRTNWARIENNEE
jgi:hypothetical protein